MPLIIAQHLLRFPEQVIATITLFSFRATAKQQPASLSSSLLPISSVSSVYKGKTEPYDHGHVGMCNSLCYGVSHQPAASCLHLQVDCNRAQAHEVSVPDEMHVHRAFIT